MPAIRPPALLGYRNWPASLRMNGASWTITCAIAPAPMPSRNATRLPLNAEAPIQAPAMAGPPASSPRPASVRSEGRFLRDRGDDGEPLGRVVDREPDHEQGAERECAGGVGGADREPLAEVVEADPDGDEQREVEAAGLLAAGRRPPAGAHRRVDRGQRQVADDRSEVDECLSAEGLRALAGDLDSLEQGVHDQEHEQADRERDQHADDAMASSAAGAAARACPSSTGITPT